MDTFAINKGHHVQNKMDLRTESTTFFWSYSSSIEGPDSMQDARVFNELQATELWYL
jgi:hypothetical protein